MIKPAYSRVLSFLLLIGAYAFLPGCLTERLDPTRTPVLTTAQEDPPEPSFSAYKNTSGQYRELSQYDTVELAPFVALIPENLRFPSAAKHIETYIKNWFSPWQNPSPPPKSQLEWGVQYVSKKTWYQENRRPVSTRFLTEVVSRMALHDFPNNAMAAVSVRPAELRYWPDHGSLFETPDDFPFDMALVTTIGPGTPLSLWHISGDGLWAYVVAPFASGWLPMMDLATMTPRQTQWVMAHALGSVVHDKVAIASPQSKRPIATVSIGQHFPLAPSPNSVYLPVRQPDGTAAWVVGRFTNDDIQPLGIPWSRDTVASLAAGVLGQPYGWAGMFFHRDCSAMVRDLMAPFGLWLPRNSAAQAKQGGRFLDLHTLSDQEKKQKISENGRPFLTLLWLKGHVMLYVGSLEGEPMALHNIWAVRVRDAQGQPQKVVIGRTVITDLEPGKSLPDFDVSQSLLHRIEGMTFLGE